MNKDDNNGNISNYKYSNKKNIYEGFYYNGTTIQPILCKYL